MTSRSDDRPRHEQIAADIRAKIMAGDLPTGSQLPSIPRLVTKYAAATATVQRALAALKEEGSIYSKVGKGVYVRDRQPLVIDVAAYVPHSRTGYVYRLLEVAEVVPPVEVAGALDLSSGEAAVLRQRLLLHAGNPVELSWSYYPTDIAHGTELTGRGKISGGAPRLLADLGYPEHELEDRVSARMPVTEEVEALDLPPHVPVIRQFRVVRSGGRPVEVSILIKGSHLHELRYRHQIPGAP